MAPAPSQAPADLPNGLGLAFSKSGDSPHRPKLAGPRHEDIQLRSPRLEAESNGKQTASVEQDLEQSQHDASSSATTSLAEAYPESPTSKKTAPAESPMSNGDSPSRKARIGGDTSSASSEVQVGNGGSMARPMGASSTEAAFTAKSGSHADGLRSIAASASAVTVEDLLELGSLARPHAAVREVVQSALMLLGFRESTWAAARARFELPESFLDKLIAFDASRDVSRLQYQKLRRSFEAPKSSLSEVAAETRCRACGSLERWCRSVADMLAARYGDNPIALPSGSSKKAPDSTTGASAATPSSATGRPDDFSKVENLGLPPPRPALGDLVITPDVYALTPDELRQVRDLTIHRPRVGEVTFHGDIDLVRERRILEELPQVVRLDPGEVVLYPDASSKPAEGEGLNRPATITLFQCMPPNSAPFPDADSKMRYRTRIAQMTEQKGARFVDYDCDRGIWQFRVEHF